jgi:hypothetical protein
LLLPLVAALAVLLVACGGGDDENGDNEPAPAATTSAAGEPQATAAPASATAAAPTSAATVEDRPEVEALLKAAALRLEDLPSGYTLDDETFSTNEESAEDESDSPGAATLEDMNRFGRILGYEASYSQETSPSTLLEGGTLFLQVTTTVYRDSAGARDAFEFTRQRTSDPEFAKAFEASVTGSAGEVRDASISPMSFAEVGDDRIAFEMKFTMHNPDLNTDFHYVVQLVGIRRGRGVGAISVFAVTSPSPVGELEDLARTLDKRLKDALE